MIRESKMKRIKVHGVLKTYACRYLGDIRLSGTVHFSDPCYTQDVWCRAIKDNVLPGIYRCYAMYGERGTRVHMLLAIHSSYAPWRFKMRWTDYALLGVDSGQMGIFDDSLYPKDNGPEKVKEDFYKACCDITLPLAQAGILEDPIFVVQARGCVCSSGWGDGSYQLLTNAGKNRKKAFLIDFLSEYDSEMLLVLQSMTDPKPNAAEASQ